jgi:hypothetical protein
MKKYLILAVLTLALGSTVSALTESWIGLGFGWGNLFETASDSGNTAKTYMGSPGINFEGYSFWNRKNIGLFYNMGFLFPQKSTLDINGVKTSVDLSVYDLLFQLDFILGPGFRVNLNDRFSLKFGAGFHYMQTVGKYTQSVYTYGYRTNVSVSVLGFNLGIGADAGIKLDLTDVFYISTGAALAWDFASHTSVFTSGASAEGWASNYFAFELRPYICLGINLWGEGWSAARRGFGKPE